MSRLSHFFRDESGGSLIESTAYLTALLMLLFGVIDCTRAIYADQFVAYAARSATHYAMVRGSTYTGITCTTITTAACAASSANITSFVKSQAPLGVNTAAAALTVTPTWPGTDVTGAACTTTNGSNSPGCTVHVQVAYNFNFILPFLPHTTLVFKSNAAVTIAQ